MADIQAALASAANLSDAWLMGPSTWQEGASAAPWELRPVLFDPEQFVRASTVVGAAAVADVGASLSTEEAQALVMGLGIAAVTAARGRIPVVTESGWSGSPAKPQAALPMLAPFGATPPGAPALERAVMAKVLGVLKRTAREPRAPAAGASYMSSEGLSSIVPSFKGRTRAAPALAAIVNPIGITIVGSLALYGIARHYIDKSHAKEIILASAAASELAARYRLREQGIDPGPASELLKAAAASAMPTDTGSRLVGIALTGVGVLGVAAIVGTLLRNSLARRKAA